MAEEKRLLIALLGLLALLGCSKDHPEVEPVETGTPIVFGSRMSEEEAVTRAEQSLHEAGADAFRVYGFKNMDYDDMTASYGGLQTVFPGYAVEWRSASAGTTATNTNDWEYILTGHPQQTIKYWDLSAGAYRFMAWTSTAETTVTETIGDTGPAGATELTVTLSGLYADNIATAPFISRLWFSNGNPVDYPDKQFLRPVKMEFVKPFAKVRFLFISANPTELPISDIELSNMMFKPTNDSGIGVNGSVTVVYPLTGAETQEHYSAASTNSITALTQNYYETADPDDENAFKWYAVLPAIGQGSYTLSVLVFGEPRTAVVPASYMDWKPGYTYTYVFKVDGEGGVEFGDLRSAFTPWQPGFEGNETEFNW